MNGTPDLMAELAAMNCWCGRDPQECADLGGCAWTVEVARLRAEAARAERERIAALAEAASARYLVSPYVWSDFARLLREGS